MTARAKAILAYLYNVAMVLQKLVVPTSPYLWKSEICNARAKAKTSLVILKARVIILIKVIIPHHRIKGRNLFDPVDSAKVCIGTMNVLLEAMHPRLQVVRSV